MDMVKVHNYSGYNLPDGADSAENICDFFEELGMPVIANCSDYDFCGEDDMETIERLNYILRRNHKPIVVIDSITHVDRYGNIMPDSSIDVFLDDMNPNDICYYDKCEMEDLNAYEY